jgi:hypothetical protein
MIAALRRRLIRHARHLVLRLPSGHYLLPEILTQLRHREIQSVTSVGSC